MTRSRYRRSTIPAERPPVLPERTRGILERGVGRLGMRQAGRIVDESDSTLLDVVDNLLNRGVVLNAEIVLALADVDLVYLRVSALLCAAGRLLPPADDAAG